MQLPSRLPSPVRISSPVARPAGRSRLLAALAVVGLAAPGLALVAPAPVAQAAAAACGSLTSTVLERVDPTTQASSLTLSASQSAATASLGFTSVRDRSLLAAKASGPGLVAVHRLYRAAHGGNFFYSTSAAEIATSVARLGYTDQGTVFYASRSARSCLVAVRSYYKAGTHRFVTSAADEAALHDAGWRKERVRFYLRSAPVDPRFTIAVMPDTQQEVLTPGDGRLANRSRYLVSQRSALDLRFVTHTGDVVNWDTPDHVQYQRAAAGLAPLRAAGIPTSLSIGNHDTLATCPGGSACDVARTRVLFRSTATFNRYLGTGALDQEGAFERGRLDNTFHVFTAGGRSWLVLNLELWPRKSVVRWAQQVVASHPRDNVMVVTHSYLTASGAIYGGKGGYGDTTGRYLYDQLISRYANVRLVFSGHTGQAAHRVDHGVHGNRVDSYLLTMHSTTTNPVRLVEIDTKAATLRTWVYAPWTHHTYSGKGYSGTVHGVHWVS